MCGERAPHRESWRPPRGYATRLHRRLFPPEKRASSRTTSHLCQCAAQYVSQSAWYIEPSLARAAAASASPVSNLEVSRGSATSTMIRAGRIMFEPTGQTSSVPLMATQTTGTSSFLARSKKGALNGANFDTCSAASLHRSASKPMRVPSGKIATELPAANCVAAFSRSSPVEPLTVPQPLFLFLSNLTARSPARFIAQPPKGTLKRSYFATYLVSSGSIADPSAKGSMKERWFATTKTPFLPLTTSLGGRHDVAVLVTEMPGTYRDGGAAESSRNRYPFQNSSLVGDATNQPKV
mmetsp:Transcript_7448/g.30821  ORF Transcript_7448/g.30821 Transcript_7448/m.30821 type:complete len:295 (-) Transcript_7448:77-961(-)